ncbi:unnamed protein product [Calypogeia fissa]
MLSQKLVYAVVYEVRFALPPSQGFDPLKEEDEFSLRSDTKRFCTSPNNLLNPVPNIQPGPALPPYSGGVASGVLSAPISSSSGSIPLPSCCYQFSILRLHPFAKFVSSLA